MSLYNNITSNLYNLNSLVSDGIIKLIGSILILLIGILFSKLISKLFKKLVAKAKLDYVLKNTLKLDIPLEDFMATILKYLLYIVFLILSLQHLGLTTFILNIILIGILSILIIFVMLTLKDLIPNITAGILLHHRKLVNKGEEITIKDIKGKVIDVTLTEIKLETKNKDIIIIPNSILMKNELIKRK